MAAESRRNRSSASPRHLRAGERQLIARMVRGTSFEAQVVPALAQVLVEDMADGGMGSIRFRPDRRGRRLFGRQIGEATFADEDGVPVSATLNLDQDGQLFELDLWKADNSPLRRYPTPEQVSVIGPGVAADRGGPA